ncbi:carboxymuconolactone decarboxylase family protein [Shimazuella sp. AN120528]|uniref:carboxymuconolactone decarboxylase family protein n=1 Tax=Shimazuella soli TaxID=1892854 RepID=UPI001F0F1D8A|nr:carboxymuconolactone decarboxylase family protein [Shimazuella soli]MCH5586547.1 carboxymuconolactone decarboxylase family protein [Shimazuella soli]
MKLRLNHREVNPQLYELMLQMEKTVLKTGIDRTLYEMIKIRASQINGCSYCVDSHSKAFLDRGEEINRLIHIPIWRESLLFTDKEKAVLALTEAVTNISIEGVPDQIYENVRKHFNEKEYLDLILAINTINSWNRIGISTGMFPSCM